MSKSSLTLLFILLSCLQLQAIPIRVLAWDKNVAGRKLIIAHGQNSQLVLGMHQFARSRAINVPKKSETLRLEDDSLPLVEGKKPSIPLVIPGDIIRPLLLVVPDKASPIGLKSIIVEDDPSKFLWGTTRFINATSQDLVFQYNKKNVLIPSGWKPTSVNPKGVNGNMAISLYSRKAGPKDGPIYSSIWKHLDVERQLVFIIPSKDKTRGKVDFKFITENRNAVQAQQNAANNGN